MTYLDIRSLTPELQRGNVSAIIGMLSGIRELIADDEIMEDIAETIEKAIRQLNLRRQLAYETMLEIDAEQDVTQQRPCMPSKKPH